LLFVSEKYENKYENSRNLFVSAVIGWDISSFSVV
jgi:hypothetical protein